MEIPLSWRLKTMRRIYITFFVACVLVGFLFAGCSDDDFASKHIARDSSVINITTK